MEEGEDSKVYGPGLGSRGTEKGLVSAGGDARPSWFPAPPVLPLRQSVGVSDDVEQVDRGGVLLLSKVTSN